MIGRPQYFEEFVSYWSGRSEVRKIWFSLFTPQVGAEAEEILSHDQRDQVLAELTLLRSSFPKLKLPDLVIEGYRKPPASPGECIFARTTINFTADLQSKITPCQFGGNPDCSQCGCLASAGLKAVTDRRLMGFLPVSALYNASDAIGKVAARFH
jgi:DNA-directed RNA polymerase subunit H (RpoH/RPB5)